MNGNHMSRIKHTQVAIIVTDASQKRFVFRLLGIRFNSPILLQCNRSPKSLQRGLAEDF